MRIQRKVKVENSNAMKKFTLIFFILNKLYSSSKYLDKCLFYEDDDVLSSNNQLKKYAILGEEMRNKFMQYLPLGLNRYHASNKKVGNMIDEYEQFTTRVRMDSEMKSWDSDKSNTKIDELEPSEFDDDQPGQ